MIKTLTIFFAAMQTVGGPIEVPDPIRTYMDCIVLQATILEPSGESAETIAQVAIPKCDALIGDAAGLMADEWLARPEVQRLPADLQIARPTLLLENEKLLLDGARTAIVRVVVEDRAIRNGKKNAPNN